MTAELPDAARVRAAVAAATPKQRKVWDDAQRDAWTRSMTSPCAHGVRDIEQCGACRVGDEPRIAPQSAAIERIVREIVRRHPTGWQLERAAREAAELGWHARDTFDRPGVTP